MRVRWILAVITAGALAASCSSSAGKSSGANASTTSAAPAASTTPTTTPAAQVAARASAGCSTPTNVAAGEAKVNTRSSGVMRWYYRHVPASYTGTKPMPVVIDLHGYVEGATIHEAMSALGPFGDTHGFITITPQGSGTAVSRWDTGFETADMKYIGDLLDEVERTLCADERRIFVTGLSNGAFMTSAIACKYSDRIAAVAPVAGIRDIAGCTFTRPVPVIAFHGTADPFVSYGGGLGPKALGLPTPDGKGTFGQSGLAKSVAKGPSIPKITADWAKRNGCGTTPSERSVTSDVTSISFPCPAGAEVVLDRITGGGHSWPGSAFSQSIASVVGPTTMTISADAVMWQFFEAHPLRD
jgi:polyhydroxybutyrate depolymerase